MKKPLLILAGVLASFGPLRAASPLDPPATHPEGVAEVTWGSSQKEVEKVMLARSGVSLVSKTSEKMQFSGGSFADQAVAQWEFQFIAGRFTEAFIRMKPEDHLREYEKIRKVITAKYRKNGREERENPQHRATYWDYSLTTGKWGILCDAKPGAITLVYKDKTPAPLPRRPIAKDFWPGRWE